MAFLVGDYARVADVHFRAGYVAADQDRGAFTLALRAIGEPILGVATAEISIGRLLGQLFHVTETFGMRTQPHLLLLQKVMVVSEGVGRSLHPEANMWQLAQPLTEAWVADHLGPAARIAVGAGTAIELAQRLPRLARRAEQALERLAAWDNGAARRTGNGRLLMAFAAGAGAAALLLSLT